MRRRGLLPHACVPFPDLPRVVAPRVRFGSPGGGPCVRAIALENALPSISVVVEMPRARARLLANVSCRRSSAWMSARSRCCRCLAATASRKISWAILFVSRFSLECARNHCSCSILSTTSPYSLINPACTVEFDGCGRDNKYIRARVRESYVFVLGSGGGDK